MCSPLTGTPREATAGEMMMLGVAADTFFVEQRRRWGTAVDLGLVIVPNVLLRYQQQLQLDTVDIVLILNIVDLWDDEDRLPFPRISVLADRIDRHRRTVERSIAKLRDLGYLVHCPSEVVGGQTIRRFDLSGLIARLQELSRQAPQRHGRRRTGGA